jgi:hypothetical protein
MKKIILIICLLLPVGVFVFLRYFGKNEFSIPVYYENGVDDPPTNCNRKYDSPYQVSESALLNFGWKGKPVLIVADSSRSVQLGINRLEEGITVELQTLFLTGKDEYLDQFYSCDLLLKDPWKIVLIDEQRRIRGYYDPETREEVDRLAVELKILLKKY